MSICHVRPILAQRSQNQTFVPQSRRESPILGAVSECWPHISTAASRTLSLRKESPKGVHLFLNLSTSSPQNSLISLFAAQSGIYLLICDFFLLNDLVQQDRLAITAQCHWWYCEDEWGLRGVREADLTAAQGPLVHPNCRKSQPSRLTQVPSQRQPTGHWALRCCSRSLIKI